MTKITTSRNATYTTCAVADGAAYCWGSAAGYGTLGSGVNSGTTPVPIAVNTAGVLAGKTVTDITLGYAHACVIADGKAYCWGLNTPGQLGNNSTVTSNLPVEVGGVLSGLNVTAISAGNSHTCAVANNAAYCWGAGSSGRLGNSASVSSSIPVAVTGALSGKTVTAISAGDQGSCAVASGEAYCWGRGEALGINTYSDSNTSVAVDISGALAGKTVTAVYAADRAACALADALYCWGSLSDYAPLTPHSFTANGAGPTDKVTSFALTVTSSARHCAIANDTPYCSN